MPRKRSIPSRIASSQKMDDLKVICGIGPVTEKLLHDAGIQTYRQLANLSVKAIQALVPTTSENQIKKQDWVGQAYKLAPARAKRDHGKDEIPINRQHYENFTLEFLLDEKNKIHCVRAVHIQSGDKDTWSNWDNERLTTFLAWHTGARFPQGKLISPTFVEPSTSTASLQQTSHLLEVAPHPSPSQLVPAPVEKLEPESPSPSNPIRLLEWDTLSGDTAQPIHTLSHDKIFNVKLKLDISKTSLSNSTQVDVTGMLYAKKLGGGSRQIISETQQIVPYSPILDLTLENATLAQGIYRLKALVKVHPSEDTSLPAGIDASFQGGLFQVY